jgi:hypothetical protein
MLFAAQRAYYLATVSPCEDQADISRTSQNVRYVPILLQKSVEALPGQ